VPLYLLSYKLHLYNTLFSLMLTMSAAAVPVLVLIMVSFVRDVPARAHPVQQHGRAAHVNRSQAGYRPGSDRGSPNHGNTLASKRVMAQIWSPVRVRTNRPVAWRMPAGPRR
jgi:hypothetical protein